MGSIDPKSLEVDSKIKYLEKVSVIKNYYLVIGGGKVGTYFMEYAVKNEFPFVLVIDRNENALASREAKVLKNENELVNLLKKKAAASLSKKIIGYPVANEKEKGSYGPEAHKPEAYFYKADVHSIPSLFTFGIPEYIIPAVPCHVVAFMLADLLEFPNPETNTKEIQRITPPACELSIKPEDSGFMSFFKSIETSFPEDIIAGSYPEQGILFFSYAREGEICPDGCHGPREYCPTFGRNKPKTITEHVRELRHSMPGWVFESHQMKPGIGGLKGIELKKNLLEILEFIKIYQKKRSGKEFETIENGSFFIATTCTCHGVLNLFCVKR